MKTKNQIVEILNKHLGYSTAINTTTEIAFQLRQFDAIADELQQESSYANEEIIEAFNLAIKTIRAWHGMRNVEKKDEEMMWGIYNRNSPEMKRLNSLIESIKSKEKDISSICKGCGDPIDTNYCNHCKEQLSS